MLLNTIREIKESYKGEYDYMEVYKPYGIGEHYPNHFHTDNCSEADDYTEDSVAGLVELMDENDYNNSILANCGIVFSDLFDQDEKILCIMLVNADGDSKRVIAVDVHDIGEKFVDIDQNTFIDEETGYEIYITEDNHWIAE